MGNRKMLMLEIPKANKNNLILGKMVVSKRRTFPPEPSFNNASIPQRCPVCIYTADVFSAHEILICLLLRKKGF